MVGRRGSVAIEFALLAPVMILLAGCIYELGSLLQANVAVNRLAMLYAISFADCSDTSSGVCLTELNLYKTASALGNIAPQLSATSLTVTMAQVSVSGTTNTVEYPAGLSLTTAQSTALQNAALPGGVSGQTYVVVTATYVYTPQIFPAVVAPFVGSSITLSYTVAQLK
jgi:Flp pilus assembly protein TadG